MWTIEPPTSLFSRAMIDRYGSTRGFQSAFCAGVFGQSLVKNGTMYSWLTQIRPSSPLPFIGKNVE